MSLNNSVRFVGGSLASPRPMIRHLGIINPNVPIVKTEEAVGLVGGAGLLGAGLLIKGKGGMIMSILGGLVTLVTGGLTVMRHVNAPPALVVPVAPPMAPTAPKPASGAQQLLTTLAPYAQQLAPLVKDIFNREPAPAPASPFVTSL